MKYYVLRHLSTGMYLSTTDNHTTEITHAKSFEGYEEAIECLKQIYTKTINDTYELCEMIDV